MSSILGRWNGGTGWRPRSGTANATFIFATDWPAQDEYEVRVYDSRSGRRLVAALEIVSPSNKDRPEHRRAFVANCAALLQERVCVVVLDLVTTRTANLFRDLLDLLGETGTSSPDETSPLYAVTCRSTKNAASWLTETWMQSLSIGQPLPTLPLWLADDLAVPLDLDSSYEETCRDPPPPVDPTAVRVGIVQSIRPGRRPSACRRPLHRCPRPP